MMSTSRVFPSLEPNEIELIVCELQVHCTSCADVNSSPCFPMSKSTSQERKMCPLATYGSTLVLNLNSGSSSLLHSPNLYLLILDWCISPCLLVCDRTGGGRGYTNNCSVELSLLSWFLQHGLSKTKFLQFLLCVVLKWFSATRELDDHLRASRYVDGRSYWSILRVYV